MQLPTPFVFLSVYDNSRLVIQAAGGFGLPSVEVRGRSSPESFLDGVNGLLIENETTGDLTKKIMALMHDQHAIKIAGEGARKSKYHPRESIIDDMLQVRRTN